MPSLCWDAMVDSRLIHDRMRSQKLVLRLAKSSLDLLWSLVVVGNATDAATSHAIQ